jgi:glycerol-1-phosphate dehydrogenase [NAD(P)+]
MSWLAVVDPARPAPITIGEPFLCQERPVLGVLEELGAPTVAVNDPPWSQLAGRLSPPRRVVTASSMELAHLEALAAEPDDGDVVVGIGGGTALDTAKFLAWRTGRPLVQVPSITSVDAGFTDAVGVRVAGRVRYVGRIVPQFVALDLDLIRSAPPHLNRAGIGDVLSCHTGLHDWRLAVEAGHGHPWDEDLAGLGRSLLAGLDEVADEVAAVSAAGIRFLADAYRRIGAACGWAGHSRFEEGSEHFWAYAYEHATGAHHVHGELIALGVAALSVVQGNEPGWVRAIIERSGCRAHPHDLAISEAQFRSALLDLAAYARDEQLDVSVADLRPITPVVADEAWAFVTDLPRVGGGGGS